MDPTKIDPIENAARCSFDANAVIGVGSEIVGKAGRGDLASLQILVDLSMQAALDSHDDDPYAIVTAAEAITFARLCASHGVRADVRRLAGALCLTSERTRKIGFETAADTLMGESIAILEQLAGEGDDVAAMASEALVRGNANAIASARASLLIMEG